MPTPEAHYREAEACLGEAVRAIQKATETDSNWARESYIETAELSTRIAQVHATLATVAK